MGRAKRKNQSKNKTSSQSEEARKDTHEAGKDIRATGKDTVDVKANLAAMLGNLGDDWQVDKSLLQCLQYLFDHNKEFRDVTFKLTTKRDNEDSEEDVYIPALQTLLLARSPVFCAMFSGSMSNKKDDQLIIDLPDVEPDAFRECLRYIYTDEVHLTADNVTSIMYLSKKYMINNLTKECVKFLEQKMSAETAPILLEQSMFFDEKELMNKALAKIAETAPAVLSSDEFSKMSHQALNQVLQLNLKIEKELEVFQACMKWAEQKCVELKQPVEGDRKREVLAENLFLIRFPVMSIDDFSEHVVQNDVLTAEEERKIFRYIASSTNKPKDLPFHTKPRRFERYLNMGKTYACVLTEIKLHETITFTTNFKCQVSRPIRIRRLLVAASDPTKFRHQVTLSVTQNGRRLTSYIGSPEKIEYWWDSFCVIELDDVITVEAGPMELFIHIALTKNFENERSPYLYYAEDNLTQMSDDYVTIEFSPVEYNLLNEIAYSIPL